MSGAIMRYAEAWERGDIAAMIDLYAPDIIVHYGGTSEFAGTHHGRDRLVEILVETAMRSDRKLVSIDQIDDHEHHGALFVTETMRVDDATVTLRRALRFRVADGRLAECWLYDHDQHLVDAAWRSPDGDAVTAG
jgi:uncharacterized protein